ncbi:MAG: PmoA family protein, partial [Planctomycetes bacterium]|nr:PmoA family protein [Planctomycetota bacterium]
VERDSRRQSIDVIELAWPPPARPKLPVLRYNHGSVPVPDGTHPHFAEGESYERGDYIHPLFGPDGETLTDDYPADHPHHRGVWWSWPLTRYQDQIADIWAVLGVWARPVAVRRIESGPVMALIDVENVWEFGKEKKPVVRAEVLIRAFRQTDRSRFVDVEVRLTALADDVAIGGRPKRGYGGFSLRAAVCEDRKITLHADPDDASPRRSWVDYSGVFPGGQGPAGTAIFEHVSNPDYPNPLHEYPGCNCVMPAYPDVREVVLSKEKPLVLKHRLWIHSGGADEKKLTDVWTAYAAPPEVTTVNQ